MNNTPNPFTDGAEQRLLDLFLSEDPETEQQRILRDQPSWPLRYHLSPLRANLLNWYPLGAQKRILEIGAGCGALTGVLLGDTNTVTAIELSESRAAVIRARHQKHIDRLTIHQQSFEDFQTEDSFDVITSIGVFEYTGAFYQSVQGPQKFLAQAKALLKPGGVFILAIENQFGIKYWSGAREDHTGNYFESIENYPEQQRIKTYGRKELEDMLSQAGFSRIQFYYPFPDYKLPVEIFSDHYLPGPNHPMRSGLFPTEDHSQNRAHLFDEGRAMEGIIANGMLPFFANSFLVFAYC